jgi:hypothetical protein
MTDIREERLDLSSRNGIGRLGHQLLTPVSVGTVDEVCCTATSAGVNGNAFRVKDIEQTPVRFGEVRDNGRLHAESLKSEAAVGDNTSQPLRGFAVFDDVVDRDRADDGNGCHVGRFLLHTATIPGCD